MANVGDQASAEGPDLGCHLELGAALRNASLHLEDEQLCVLRIEPTAQKRLRGMPPLLSTIDIGEQRAGMQALVERVRLEVPDQDAQGDA